MLYSDGRQNIFLRLFVVATLLTQMKADYATRYARRFATRSARNGWRRMTFIDVDAWHGGGGGKTLASFELHKVSRCVWRDLLLVCAGAGAGVAGSGGVFGCCYWWGRNSSEPWSDKRNDYSRGMRVCDMDHCCHR